MCHRADAELICLRAHPLGPSRWSASSWPSWSARKPSRLGVEGPIDPRCDRGRSRRSVPVGANTRQLLRRSAVVRLGRAHRRVLDHVPVEGSARPGVRGRVRSSVLRESHHRAAAGAIRPALRPRARDRRALSHGGAATIASTPHRCGDSVRIVRRLAGHVAVERMAALP